MATSCCNIWNQSKTKSENCTITPLQRCGRKHTCNVRFAFRCWGKLTTKLRFQHGPEAFEKSLLGSISQESKEQHVLQDAQSSWCAHPEQPDIVSLIWSDYCAARFIYKRLLTVNCKCLISVCLVIGQQIADLLHQTNLEYKRLVEHRVQCFLVHFGVKLLLLVRQEQDFNVRIRGAARVHGHQVRSLKDANCELWAQEAWEW